MNKSFSQGVSGIGLEGVFVVGWVGSGLYSYPRGLSAQEVLAGCQLTLRKVSLECSQNSPMYFDIMFCVCVWGVQVCVQSVETIS